jgi:hypothetical protein
MDPQTLANMLREDRDEWAALAAALDARPDGPLHDPESPEWTARDVYAHLARWINNSTDGFESWLANRTLPPPPPGDDDEINARWQAEDSALTFDEARARAQRAFDRRVRAIESAPADRWDDALEALAHADDAHHYRAHRSYIAAGTRPNGSHG